MLKKSDVMHWTNDENLVIKTVNNHGTWLSLFNLKVMQEKRKEVLLESLIRAYQSLKTYIWLCQSLFICGSCFPEEMAEMGETLLHHFISISVFSYFVL